MIQIDGNTYVLKYSLRNYFVFENLAGRIYELGRMSDEYLLFYSTLLACNPTFGLSFDEFIDRCDADPNLFIAYIDFFTKAVKIQSQLIQGDEVKKKRKEKKSA
ncbi:MAG: hypothetical protein LBS88_07190 [Tannerellaceae bacterium]|nr:hypothetical protein [Tannerellaceae bacterium]